MKSIIAETSRRGCSLAIGIAGGARHGRNCGADRRAEKPTADAENDGQHVTRSP